MKKKFSWKKKYLLTFIISFIVDSIYDEKKKLKGIFG